MKQLVPLLSLIALAALFGGCANVDQLVEESEELRMRNWQVEQELQTISRQFPELRERIDLIFAYAQQNKLDLNALAMADDRIKTVVAGPQTRNQEILNEIEEVRSQAARIDSVVQAVHGKAVENAYRANRVAEQAVMVRDQQELMRGVANLLGTPFGLKLGGDKPDAPQPLTPNGGDTPLGWMLGLGTAAMGGAGLWAYRRYGPNRGSAGAQPAPPGSINVSVGTPAPSYQPMRQPAPVMVGGSVAMSGQTVLPATYGAGPGGAGSQQPFRYHGTLDTPLPTNAELAAAAEAAQELVGTRSLRPDLIRSDDDLDVSGLQPHNTTHLYRRRQVRGQ